MKILQFGIVLILALSLWGCGKGNPASPASADPVTKKVHSDPNWLATTHKRTKASEIPNCAECHGGDFKGGIVNVACIKCHPKGPQGGPPHPIDGSTFLPAAQHGAEAKKSLAFCGGCHGNGVNQPFNTLPILGNARGCAFCHSQNINLAHPYGWVPGPSTTSHATAGDIVTSCGLCHGASLDGVGGIAPSCFLSSPIAGTTCHFTKPVNPAGASVGCVSCHGGSPTGPNGTIFPNAANLHPKHTAISGVTCSTCHNGAGIGTSLHGSRNAAAVSFDTTQATALYNPGTKTCANITCHRGVTTPAWTSVNSGLGCTICHSPPQNTFRHPTHLSLSTGITCDICHNDGPGVATHTTQNPVIVGSPLPSKFNENGLIASYDPATGKCSNVSCHGGLIIAFPIWKSATVLPNTCLFACHTLSNSTPASYTGPYIGPFSGGNTSNFTNLHNGHAAILGNGQPTVCLHCHATPGVEHFANIMLGKRAITAENTITGSGIVSYSPVSGCVTTCHVIAPPDPRRWH